MNPVSDSNFGPLIAYLVPGATALAGLAQFSPTVGSLFVIGQETPPTISGFLYLTLASVAAGMTVAAIRWAFVDSIHAMAGLRPPKLDFRNLPGKVDAFALLIEIHYRHYQFYANMFVAALISYLALRTTTPLSPWLDVPWFALESIFFLTSRDTLKKYYSRTAQLLSPAEMLAQLASTGVDRVHAPRRRRTPAASSPVS